jgi:sulfite reductase alpha subunit-like flavoprotein
MPSKDEDTSKGVIENSEIDMTNEEFLQELRQTGRWICVYGEQATELVSRIAKSLKLDGHPTLNMLPIPLTLMYKDPQNPQLTKVVYAVTSPETAQHLRQTGWFEEVDLLLLYSNQPENWNGIQQFHSDPFVRVHSVKEAIERILALE